jgi:hypothetical protein
MTTNTGEQAAGAIDWTRPETLEVVDRTLDSPAPIVWISTDDMDGYRHVYWVSPNRYDLRAGWFNHGGIAPFGSSARIRPRSPSPEQAGERLTGAQWRQGLREAGGKRWDDIADPDTYIAEGRAESRDALPVAATPTTEVLRFAKRLSYELSLACDEESDPTVKRSILAMQQTVIATCRYLTANSAPAKEPTP